LITAPHAHAIQTPVPVDRRVELAETLVLLVEGVEV